MSVGARSPGSAWPRPETISQVGLWPKTPAIVRRVADRGADIGAGVQPGQTRRERRRRSARGATGRAGEIPRIAAGAMDRVEALPVRQHERDIGLAEDHGASGAVPLDHGRVRVRDVVAELRNTPCRGRPCQVEAVLDRHRQAVEGAGGFPRRAAPVRGVGFLPRALDVLPDNGVDCLIVPFDAVEKVIEQLARTNFARIEQRHQSGGRLVVDFRHPALPVLGRQRCSPASPPS